MNTSLSISGKNYLALKNHLFPGDGNEAVALALCGKYKFNGRLKLLVHKIFPIPYEECVVRTPDMVHWKTEGITAILETASKKNLSLLKIHSHPNDYKKFSDTDDKADTELFSSVFGWMNNDDPHASAIMLPNGEIIGRIITKDLEFRAIDRIAIAGDDLLFWDKKDRDREHQEFERRTAQTFGTKTTSLLNKLKIAIIGCSGTGSPLIEQLTRLGVGELCIIDPDIIEEKNINRILNSTMDDASNKRLKVDVMQASINKIGIKTIVKTYSKNLYNDVNIIKDISGYDIIFGCVDSVDGRHLLNQISSFYLIPYFDLGVKIISDGQGGISQVCGTVHYIQPGGGSLITRGVYTVDELSAAGLSRIDPAHYNKLKAHGYIVDVEVDSPAVISINMQIASMAVNEFLARVHPYRYDKNSEFAINRISLFDGYYQKEGDDTIDYYLNKFEGIGDILPLLNMPELN